MDRLELLRKRLDDLRASRERETVHPKDCKCKGHGSLPMSQFIMGFVKCQE